MSRKNEYKTNVGQRIGRFLLLVGLVFAIVAAVVATQRFSTDTLALIAGLVIGGALLAVPFLAAAWVVVRVWDYRERRKAPTQSYTVPPVVLQMPQQPTQALPDYRETWQQSQPRAARSWEVIGDE